MPREFLWGLDRKGQPPIAWENVCKPKSKGGLGIKNIDAWNKALIAKHIWAVCSKKDNLWVKWVHSRYIKTQEWWEVKAKPDDCWYWKKFIKVRECFADLMKTRDLAIIHEGEYNSKKGYTWLNRHLTENRQTKIVWNRTNVPKHSCFMWMLVQGRLPVRNRLAKHIPAINDTCGNCSNHEETISHMLFDCHIATEIRQQTWGKISRWQPTSLNQWIRKMQKGKYSRKDRSFYICVMSVVLYQTWQIRNERVFNDVQISAEKAGRKVEMTVNNRLEALRKYRRAEIDWNNYCIDNDI